MVHGLCDYWYLFYGIGSICTIISGLAFNINERQREVKSLQPGMCITVNDHSITAIALHIAVRLPALVKGKTYHEKTDIEKDFKGTQVYDSSTHTTNCRSCRNVSLSGKGAFSCEDGSRHDGGDKNLFISQRH